MPSGPPRLTIRPADDEQYERWLAAAKRAGLSLAELALHALDALAEVPPPARAPSRPSRGRAAAGCERERHHRPGVYCKACETVQ